MRAYRESEEEQFKERVKLLNAVYEASNEMFCRPIVESYLASRNWTLIDAASLSAEIYLTLSDTTDYSQAEIRQQIESQVWSRYAAIMHMHCCNPASNNHQLAWAELHGWLEAHVGIFIQDEQCQAEVVQVTLAKLQRYFADRELNAGYALFVFALQSLRNANIDLFRAERAQKRQHDLVCSIEELHKGTNDNDDAAWDEMMADGNEPRQHEEGLISAETNTALIAFFKTVLSSNLQLTVANLLYCEGLAPKQIAAKLEKKPHEVRMVKSRIVQKLRALPPEKQADLLTLLQRID